MMHERVFLQRILRMALRMTPTKRMIVLRAKRLNRRVKAWRSRSDAFERRFLQRKNKAAVSQKGGYL